MLNLNQNPDVDARAVWCIPPLYHQTMLRGAMLTRARALRHGTQQGSRPGEHAWAKCLTHVETYSGGLSTMRFMSSPEMARTKYLEKMDMVRRLYTSR